jgi:glycosyltransferase involved in cell wall biosynthesis
MDLLPRAIQSVLDQSFTEWELIIVDDGSRDKTSEIVTPYLVDSRIRFFSLRVNCGVGAARNHGVRQARGGWVVLLDSDNAIAPDALSIMSQAIQSYPEAYIHKFCVKSFEGKLMCESPNVSTLITGEDYLRCRFKGEHHTLVRCNLLSCNPFLEEVNGGEGIVWSIIALQSKVILYHPYITQLYETNGIDRLSVRTRNYQRLKHVYFLDIKTLWQEYLKICPTQLMILCLKFFFYFIASKFWRSEI